MKYANPQNQLIRESIFTALMILMEKKSFEEISITELAKKAGVSRMSYYRNYHSKEDIISLYIDDILDEYTKISNYEKHNRYHRKYLFIECFKNNERLLRNLINSGLTYLILDRINRLINKDLLSPCLPEFDQQNVRFAVGGLYNVIIEWLKYNMTESIDELTAKLCEYPAESI